MSTEPFCYQYSNMDSRIRGSAIQGRILAVVTRGRQGIATATRKGETSVDDICGGDGRLGQIGTSFRSRAQV